MENVRLVKIRMFCLDKRNDSHRVAEVSKQGSLVYFLLCSEQDKIQYGSYFTLDRNDPQTFPKYKFDTTYLLQ